MLMHPLLSKIMGYRAAGIYLGRKKMLLLRKEERNGIIQRFQRLNDKEDFQIKDLPPNTHDDDVK